MREPASPVAIQRAPSPEWTALCHACGHPTVAAGSIRGRFHNRRFDLRHCEACRFSFVQDPWTDFANIYTEAYYAGHGADPLVDYLFELEHPEETVRVYEWKGILEVVTSLMPATGHKRWLDYGCGNGGLVRYVRERSPYQILGLEEGWICGRARAAGIPVVDAASLSADNGSFDS